MLQWSLIFLSLTLVTGGLSFTHKSGVIVGVARVAFLMALAIFFVFLMLAIIAEEILT